MSRLESPIMAEQRSVVDSIRTIGPGLLYLCNQNAAQREVAGDDAEWVQTALHLPNGEMRVVRLADGEKLPTIIEEQRIIIGGSPFAAYDDQAWIREVSGSIPDLQRLGIPILGICFGHQIIAQGLGGKVEKNPKGYEFGSRTVFLNQQGKQDRLFHGVSEEVNVAQSHSDIVTELPLGQNAHVLAENDMGIQSVSYGDTIRTVQFHPELRPDVLGPLARKRKERLVGRVVPDEVAFEALIEEIMKSDFQAVGQMIMANFYNGIT